MTAPIAFWCCFLAILLAVVFASQNMPWPTVVSCFVAIGAFFTAIEAAGNDEESGE